MSEVQTHIEGWNTACFVFGLVLDVIVFLVWLGGRMALAGLDK